MKNLIFLLVPLLFLSSCSIDWNDEKDKKISDLEKQIQSDTFSKKQECLKYEGNVKERYSNDLNYYFVNIFYSHTYDSCLYRITRKTSGDYQNIILDYLSGKEIFWKNDNCSGIDGNSCEDRQKTFNNILES